jgi:hypothetical protein
LDALGQVAVLHHVADLQILVIDRVVLAYERERVLVVEVLSLAAHFLIRLGEQDNRQAVSVAALLAARDTTVAGF